MVTAVAKDLIFFAGGVSFCNNNSFCGSSILDIYNITSNTWTTRSLTVYGAQSAVVVNDKVVFSCGYYSNCKV
jgi:hypothetical protein